MRELAPHLLPFLEDIEPGIRWRAVKALGDVDAKDDAPRLAEMLVDIDSYVRRCALRSLAMLVAKEQTGKMLALLRDEEPEVTREAADEASGLATAEQIKAAAALAGDEDGFVRWGAIRFLIAAEAKAELPGLLERLKAGPTRDLVRAAGFLGGPEQRETVAAALRSDDAPLRIQGAFALARLGGGLNELDAVEKTSEGAVRLAASIGLLRLGRKDRASAAALLAEVVRHREEPDYMGFVDELLDALSAGLEKGLHEVLSKPVPISKRVESVKELEAALAKAGVTQASDTLPELRRRLPAGASLTARRTLEWSFGSDARLVPSKGRIFVMDPDRALDHWRKRLAP
jgi:HEAT repeat protein